jgi:hypothetical protein
MGSGAFGQQGTTHGAIIVIAEHDQRPVWPHGWFELYSTQDDMKRERSPQRVHMCGDSVTHLGEGLAHDGGRAGVVVDHVAHNEDQRGLQVVDLRNT